MVGQVIDTKPLRMTCSIGNMSKFDNDLKYPHYNGSVNLLIYKSVFHIIIMNKQY